MFNLEKVKTIGISTLALTALIVACDKQHGYSTLNVPGTPVEGCSSTPTISRIIFIHLHNTLEELGASNPTVTRQVYYKDLPAGSAADNESLDDLSNNSTHPNDWLDYANETNTIDTNSATANIVVPYSIEFKTMPALSPDPAWVDVRIILDDSASSPSNLTFYRRKNGAIDGVTVDNKDIVKDHDICLPGNGAPGANPVLESDGANVLHVYLLSPQPDPSSWFSTKKVKYTFNIALVGKHGAITTPITIDPKIYNNG